MKYIPDKPQQLMDQWLWTHDDAALFVGMGIGKTAAVLHHILDRICDGAIYGVLVVAPLRVVNLTWPREHQEWDGLDCLKIANLRTKEGWQQLLDGTADIYLCNYEMLPKLQAKYLQGRRQLAFNAVVWDELTKAKNHRSSRINVVRPYFRAKCKYHWGLTGTPMPNSYLELFAQIRLLDDGKAFGRAFGMFKQTYFSPTDYMEYHWELKPGAAKIIEDKLRSIAITLTSEEWLDIPPVISEDIEVSLPKEVAAQYAELEREMILMVDGETFTAANAAVLVNKLLQLTSGAMYRPDNQGYTIIHTAKLDALKKVLKQIGDEPILIACNYRHEQDRIMEMLPKAVRFDQAKNQAEQTWLVEQWNKKQIKYLLANPQSIGHGLNLQAGGRTIVWYTTPWSRELYDQMIARLARRGQTQETRVFRLITRETMDEVVAEVLDVKGNQQAALLKTLMVWRETKQ